MTTISKILSERLSYYILHTLCLSFFSLITAQAQVNPKFEWSFENSIQSMDGTINTSNPFLPTRIFSKDRFDNADAAYVFYGSNYLIINNEDQKLDFISKTGLFTLSLWVNVKEDATNKLLGATNDSGGFFLAIRGKGYAEFRLIGESGLVSRVFSRSNQVNSSTGWKHITVRGDGSKLSIFIDGELQGSANFDKALSHNIQLPEVYIGAEKRYSTPAAPSSAYMDDLKIFDAALSNKRILELYLISRNQPTEAPDYLGWQTGNQGLYTSDRISIGGSNFSKDSNFQLTVKKSILTEGVKVATFENWPDYVFAQSYPLLSLKRMDSFISANKHLPDMPSAAAIKNEGYRLEEMDALLVKKIEELTLHLIELNKKLETLEKKIKDQSKVTNK